MQLARKIWGQGPKAQERRELAGDVQRIRRGDGDEKGGQDEVKGCLNFQTSVGEPVQHSGIPWSNRQKRKRY